MPQARHEARSLCVKINLNADLGESFGAWKMGDDAKLLQVVRSANIACGFHAGDPLVMRQTVRTALAAGVSLGAHPAYPDLAGFGRRAMAMAPAELEAALLYQLGALAGIAAAEGGRLTHVKPHGALNNQACEDAALADTVARAVRTFDGAHGRRPARRPARGGGGLRRPRLHRRGHPRAAQPAGRGAS
jgi:UPF0271 protein